MTDDFEAIIGEEFKGDVTWSPASMQDYWVTFLKVVDAAETVGAIEVWRAIAKAWPAFSMISSNVRFWVTTTEPATPDDSPIYDLLELAIKAGVPALETWMKEHRVRVLNHWVDTPWGFVLSRWDCKLPTEEVPSA